MILKAAAAFGVGYVLGSKAGRGRYEQIQALARRLAARLEEQGREARFDRPRSV
jgi:hypothetical protein